MNSLREQTGFSLVEAMVALLIIAVGLLGIAGLQAYSLSNTHNARVRALAAIEASNMAAYLASNSTYWANQPGRITNVTAGSPPTLSPGTLANASTNCSVVAGCTPLEIAATDLTRWGSVDQLGLLPQGQGKITCRRNTCTIAVGWKTKQIAVNGTGAIAPSVTWFRMVAAP